MRSIKLVFEKPLVIWVLLALGHAALVWSGWVAERGWNPDEPRVLSLVEEFSNAPLPPKIGLVRELRDYGGIFYYAVSGAALRALHGSAEHLRWLHYAWVMLALYVFALLGLHFTQRNRLSPVWISVALLLLGITPSLLIASSTVSALGLFLLLLMAGVLLFEREAFFLSGCLWSAAALIDSKALLLAGSFSVARLFQESSRLIRAERLAGHLMPFAAVGTVWWAWRGVVPAGDAQNWLARQWSEHGWVRPEELSYALALLPVALPIFSWSWGVRARSRALWLGAIAAAVCIPIYFLFPMAGVTWELVRDGTARPFGLLDQLATVLAGPYKNLVLFVPWLVGAFLFSQVLLLDVLERSRGLWLFVVFWFLAMPFTGGGGDAGLACVSWALLLLSLSEGLVGEEGKLA